MNIFYCLGEDYVMLVNCGGGLVDVTIHQTNEKYISIISEIHKASETIYSSHCKPSSSISSLSSFEM